MWEGHHAKNDPLVALVCWSWTAGFVLGSASGGRVRANGVLFCLMLLVGELVGLRQPANSNAPVFALTFYRAIFPLVVQVVLVAVPSMWGMLEGVELRKLRPLLRTLLWTAASATMSGMVIEEPKFGLRLIAYWPVGYVAASALGRRKENNT